jgi:hypothetical protein
MLNLSFETWNEVFTDADIDKIFKFFKYVFESVNRSPGRKIFHNYNRPWVTAGIRISCSHKRNLYVM